MKEFAGVVIVAFRLLLEKADLLLQSALGFGNANPWFIPVWFIIMALVSLAVVWLPGWDSLISGRG